MQRVFVLDTNKKPLTPCRPKRAKQLLNRGKAAVLKMYPFTIILKEAKPDADPSSLRLKIDPGSKTTGMAILNDKTGEVVFAANLEHRGSWVKKLLDSRRAARNSRRHRKTRYRKPRFLNRTKPKGWLPPSLMSRVYNIKTWVGRFRKLAPISDLSMELVRFDMQKMVNPEISGKEYQQGELAGYEVREYLLEKFNRTCAYCGAKNVPLQVEHIVPKSKGGTNRVSNLTISCVKCNREKGNMPVEEFLKGKPEKLKKIIAQAKAPLKDAAAVNATRWNLYNRLKDTELPVEVGSGGLTKFNRTQRSLPKTHWLDAVCVGKSTPDKIDADGVFPFLIKAMGHGSRQMCAVDKFGFPRSLPKKSKFVEGFQTGDIAKATIANGKNKGVFIGKIIIRVRGYFDIRPSVLCTSYKKFSIVQKNNGYQYC